MLRSMDILYSERIFSKWLTVILGSVAALMMVGLLAQLILGPLGTRPAPDLLLLGMAVFFLLVTLNFTFLETRFTNEGVEASYGIFKKSLPWKKITVVELDTSKAFYGYGMRIGRYRGKWAQVFNTIGEPRVAFISEKSCLIVSSKDPEQMIKKARKALRN